jgi:hypothetical protein
MLFGIHVGRRPDPISRIPARMEGGWKESIRTLVEAVVLAQVATLPIILTTFNTWSLVSILANVLLSPLMLVAFPLTFLFAAIVLIVPPLAPLLAWIPGFFLGAALQLVEDLAILLPPVTANPDGYLLALLLLSRDGHRWVIDLERAWRRQPQTVVLLALMPAIGLIGALIALSM